MRMAGSTTSRGLRPSSFAGTWMSLSPGQTPALWPPSRQPAQFPSSWRPPGIPSPAGSPKPLPGLSRVAVLTNPDSPYTALYLKDARPAANSLGLELQIVEARSPNEVDAAFAAMRRGHAQALTVLPISYTEHVRIVGAGCGESAARRVLGTDLRLRRWPDVLWRRPI